MGGIACVGVSKAGKNDGEIWATPTPSPCRYISHAFCFYRRGSSLTACLVNVILPFAELENIHAGERAVIEALKYCSPDAENRRASEESERIWGEHRAQKNKFFYLLVKAVKTRNESLDPESQKLVDMMLLDFVQNGMELAEDNADELDKLHQNNARIEQLCLDFQANLREGETGEWLTTDELKGVPEYDLATYPF